MKSFKIIEAIQDDLYIIFIYENEDLVGINYHHGIGDLDSDYLINDPELFRAFCDSFNGLKSDMVNTALNVIHRRSEMNEIIDGICIDADRMIEDLIERQEALLDTYGLEMTPEELEAIKGLKEQVKKQLREMWNIK